MKLACCCVLTSHVLLSFCSNALWSLRSKRSAARARTLKSASGESSSVLTKSGKDAICSIRRFSAVLLLCPTGAR